MNTSPCVRERSIFWVIFWEGDFRPLRLSFSFSSQQKNPFPSSHLGLHLLLGAAFKSFLFLWHSRLGKKPCGSSKEKNLNINTYNANHSKGFLSPIYVSQVFRNDRRISAMKFNESSKGNIIFSIRPSTFGFSLLNKIVLFCGFFHKPEQ